MTTKAKTETASSELVWDATPTVVATLAPAKTVADIPAPIREWIDGAHKTGKVLEVTFPTGVQAKVFARHAKDYTFLHEPRLTVRIKPQPDGLTVRFNVKTYEPPKSA